MVRLQTCLVSLCVLASNQGRAAEFDPATVLHTSRATSDASAQEDRDFYEIDCTAKTSQFLAEKSHVNGKVSVLRGQDGLVGLKLPIIDTSFAASVSVNLKYGAGDQNSWDIWFNEESAATTALSKVSSPLHFDGNDSALLLHREAAYELSMACTIKPTKP